MSGGSASLCLFLNSSFEVLEPFLNLLLACLGLSLDSYHTFVDRFLDPCFDRPFFFLSFSGSICRVTRPAVAMDSKPVVDEGRARAERTGEVAGADLENQSGTGTAEATRARPTGPAAVWPRELDPGNGEASIFGGFLAHVA